MDTAQKINDAVCRLLAHKGYESTSYRDVAEESGFDRGHVQYYFPNKKLFAEQFYRRMLELSVEFLKGRGEAPDPTRPIVFSHKVGQIDYAFLQMNDQMRRLTGEMLEYRSIGAMIIDVEYEWMAQHAFYPVERTPSESGFDEFVFWNGGVFECLRNAACAGQTIDAALISASLIEHSAQAAGIDADNIDDQLEQGALSDEIVREGCAFIWDRIVGTQQAQ